MTQKSSSAYKTISEVAGQLDIQPHVLRFWESKFTQIKPMKRRGGRRYYSPKDIEILNRIHELLYKEGYTIKGAQKLLKSGKAAAAVQHTGQDNSAPAGDNGGTPSAYGFEELLKHELKLAIEELESLKEQLIAA